MILQEVISKLKYIERKIKKTTNPKKKAVYELQARPLKSALKIYYENHPQVKIEN